MAGSLTPAQAADAAAATAAHLFGGAARPLAGALAATASVNWADLQTAVASLDAALNATLNQAVAAAGGATTVIGALAQQLAPPVSGLTAQQKTVILCYVLLKRAGLV